MSFSISSTGLSLSLSLSCSVWFMSTKLQNTLRHCLPQHCWWCRYLYTHSAISCFPACGTKVCVHVFVCLCTRASQSSPDLTQFLCPQNAVQWLWQHQPLQKVPPKQQHTHTHLVKVKVPYLSQGCNGFGSPLDSFKHRGLAVGQYQWRKRTTFINNLWPIHRLSVSTEGCAEPSFPYNMSCEQCTLKTQRMEE